MAELTIALQNCEMIGQRLGDQPHPHIKAEGGNTWIITGPGEQGQLARRVLGDDALCNIRPNTTASFEIAMEVGCLQLSIVHRMLQRNGTRLHVNKEKILEVIINKCIGVEEGFVTLCSAEIRIEEVSDEI